MKKFTSKRGFGLFPAICVMLLAAPNTVYAIIAADGNMHPNMLTPYFLFKTLFPIVALVVSLVYLVIYFIIKKSDLKIGKKILFRAIATLVISVVLYYAGLGILT